MAFSGSPDFRLLFESAPGCFLALAPDLSVVAASGDWLAWAKVSREEILGRSVLDVYTTAGSPVDAGFVDMLRVSLSNVFERRAKDAATTAGWKVENVPALADGGILHIVHQVVQPVEQAAQTPGEAPPSHNQVKELQERLEQSIEELRALAYSVSHDFRAPLRAIDGWTLALSEDYGTLLDEQGLGYLSVVRQESGRMAQMIDDLVRLSRVSTARFRGQMVDFSALAAGAVERLREKYPDREVECVVAPGVAAFGDETLLESLLGALLDNAWKFTNKQARASVEFGVLEQEGERVFFVRDNGTGFDMDYADRLFSPFQKMHGVSEYPGSGVGLALARRIVRLHLGRIWAEACVGQGASFFFTLKVIP
jgi:signal transduction histidine kinase